MNEYQQSRNELLAKKVIAGLKSRNMTGYYAKTKDEALKTALSIIEENSAVSWGGSMTIEEIGLKQAVCNGNYTVYNRDICKTPEEKREAELNAFRSNYYLTGCNAITEDGILVNIDGNANRVAAIAYGPEHVIMVIGMNKITKDLDSAISRARNVAAPINTQRFPVNTPCKTTGSCVNCNAADTICNEILVTRHSGHSNRFHIILVNDTLGF